MSFIEAITGDLAAVVEAVRHFLSAAAVTHDLVDLSLPFTRIVVDPDAR